MARAENRALYVLEADKQNLEQQIHNHTAAAKQAEQEWNKQLHYKAEAEKNLKEVQDMIDLATKPKKGKNASKD